MKILNNCSRLIRYFIFNLTKLFNRVIEYCKGASKPKAKLNIDRFSSYKESRIIKRQIEHQNSQKVNIKIAGDTPQEIVGGYLHGYLSKKDQNYMHNSQIAFAAGTIDSKGALHNLDQAIYQRLEKIGIYYVAYDDNNKKRIMLPLLQNDIQFELIDSFGWLKSDPIIQKTFECITCGFENLLPLVKICYRKIKKFGFGSPITCFKRSKQDETLLNSNVKAQLQKKRLQRPLNNQKHTQEKQVQSAVNQLFLERLEHLAKIFSAFTSCSQIHANKLSAYMLFENLFNNHSEILLFQKLLENNQYGGKHLHQHSSQILAKSFELLLPYALEITNAFAIDELAKDTRLYSIIKSATQYTDSVKAEFKAHKETKERLAMLEQETSQQSSSLSIVAKSKRTHQPPTKNLTNSNPTPFKTKQEREADRNQRLAERRATLAQEMVSSHKQLQIEQQKAAEQRRLESQIKIYQLPSNELVWKIIFPNLSEDHREYVKIIFGVRESHLQISHKEVVNLAEALRNALTEHGISCGNDLFDYVISRIHHRHNSDTGIQLPGHYIDILRACFIIFGIFPEGWEPKTKEDFDAMEKYHQRLLDYFYWETRI